MMDWELVKVFLAIYRSETFAAAAEKLSVNESTVRRRLTQLETLLGTQLFIRTEGRLAFLEQHKDLADIARQIEVNTSQFVEQAQTMKDGGAVRVSMFDTIAVYLAGDIARFCNQHPEILLDLTTETHIVDLNREGVDIAIRMARPTRGNHKLRRFGSIDFGIYGSRDYLAQIAETPADNHDIVAMDVHFLHADHEFELPEALLRRRLGAVRSVAIRTDSYSVMLQLCEAGSGLAMLPRFLADESGKLVPLSPGIFSKVDVWGVVREETAALPKVRQVVEMLHGLISAHFGSPQCASPAPMAAPGPHPTPDAAHYS